MNHKDVSREQSDRLIQLRKEYNFREAQVREINMKANAVMMADPAMRARIEDSLSVPARARAGMTMLNLYNAYKEGEILNHLAIFDQLKNDGLFKATLNAEGNLNELSLATTNVEAKNEDDTAKFHDFMVDVINRNLKPHLENYALEQSTFVKESIKLHEQYIEANRVKKVPQKS